MNKEVTWDIIKNMYNVPKNYINLGNRYYIYSYSDPVVFWCVLIKDEDIQEFESYYKGSIITEPAFSIIGDKKYTISNAVHTTEIIDSETYNCYTWSMVIDSNRWFRGGRYSVSSTAQRGDKISLGLYVPPSLTAYYVTHMNIKPSDNYDLLLPITDQKFIQTGMSLIVEYFTKDSSPVTDILVDYYFYTP